MSNIQLNKGYDGEKLATWKDTDADEHYQKFINAQAGPVKIPLVEYLKAGAVTDFSVDGSVTSVHQKFTPASTKIARVSSLKVVIEDATVFDGSKFGGAAALTNGIRVFANIAATSYNLDGGTGIKNNSVLASFFARFGYFIMDTLYVGVFVMDFLPMPLRLSGEDGDYLELTVQDNLTVLTQAYATVQGVWEK